ncbi:putative RNA polymerase II mediator complex component Med8 [Cryomyces antarcticus]|uniref:Mediator of RNA polymerase II transcription subunit 8 n=1 Tax=Cryomyces antarcticus TaxID=329879 RepID=A0ABR0KV23_9PEZI|nr:mediator of RNA polymerase II transcription subunit 8 [Cryomyces antarcticus]KAK5019337.1 mediator of RNA polymerase II transcription subunit 8 [Cryomyces antarcticus]KAK5132028.1 mediator of RNA polymerase II transcription subunit 8 [Cryomyces antarcticus]KAK5150154.1 hypothetical protein LTR04_006867 [Oleoguttula sp. CCFEE 6159]
MVTVNQDELKALDQIRQRIAHLNSSLQSLQRELVVNDPLPAWTSIQSSASLIAVNLKGLLDQLQTNHAFLAAAHSYPLPSFPGRAQEGLLNQLQRKKLEPSVEDWLEQCRTAAVPFTANVNGDSLNDEQEPALLGEADLASLWEWAGPEENGIAREMDWGDDYTIAERKDGVENVVTGLKRKLDDDDEEEEEIEGNDGDEKMEDIRPPAIQPPEPSKPMMALEDILRFMSTGAEPRATAAASLSTGQRR